MSSMYLWITLDNIMAIFFQETSQLFQCYFIHNVYITFLKWKQGAH